MHFPLPSFTHLAQRSRRDYAQHPGRLRDAACVVAGSEAEQQPEAGEHVRMRHTRLSLSLLQICVSRGVLPPVPSKRASPTMFSQWAHSVKVLGQRSGFQLVLDTFHTATVPVACLSSQVQRSEI